MKIMDNVKAFQSTAGSVQQRTAETLESAADFVRTTAGEGADSLTGLAKEAGKKLDSTATYVRGIAPVDPLCGVRNRVRRNPVGSLAIAAGVGMVVAMFCRPSRRTAKA
jgi:hypothetical protein